MFQDFLAANPSNVGQCNVIIESYMKSIEYFDTCIKEHEMGIAHTDETSSEDKLKNMIDFILTEDKIQELNQGRLAELTKQEILERIIDVTKNPAYYEDFFFGSPKIDSPSF